MKRNSILIFISLGSIIFISNYFYFTRFGFYEDDYYHITLHLKKTFPEIFSFIWTRLTNWFKGHPFAFLPSVFAFAGMRTGGIKTLYIFSYIILFVNSLMMYKLLRRIYPESALFAFTAAVIFGIFPANTTKIFLAYSFTMQLSLTFLLIASILYISDWKKLSYIVITFALFTYEPSFMVFFGVPLLISNLTVNFKKEYLKHAATMAVILAVIILIRFFIEEERIEYVSENLSVFTNDIFEGIISGPAAVFKSFFYGAAEAIKNFNSGFLFFLTAGIVIFFVTTVIIMKGDSKQIKNSGTESNKKKSSGLLRLAAVSVVLIALSYTIPLIQAPVTIFTGVLSSIHTASVFGSSILVSSVFLFCFNFVKIKPLRISLVLVLSVITGLMVCYNVIIQKDFVQSWENQKTFWSEVKRLCPDVSDSTVIFVMQNENNILPQTTYISSNSWTDPIILKQIYQFPEYWRNPSRVFVMREDFEKRVSATNDGLEWKVPEATWDAHTEILPDSNVIILNVNGDKLERNFGTVEYAGKELILRPKDSPLFKAWKIGPLNYFLIKPE